MDVGRGGNDGDSSRGRTSNQTTNEDDIPSDIKAKLDRSSFISIRSAIEEASPSVVVQTRVRIEQKIFSGTADAVANVEIESGEMESSATAEQTPGCGWFNYKNNKVYNDVDNINTDNTNIDNISR